MARPPLVPGKKKILAYSTASVIKHGAYLYKEEEGKKKRGGDRIVAPVEKTYARYAKILKRETTTQRMRRRPMGKQKRTRTRRRRCRHADTRARGRLYLESTRLAKANKHLVNRVIYIFPLLLLLRPLFFLFRVKSRK